MICPLLKMAQIIHTQGTAECECLEEKCAWWVMVTHRTTRDVLTISCCGIKSAVIATMMDIDRGEHKCPQEKIDLVNKGARGEKKPGITVTKHI